MKEKDNMIQIAHLTKDYGHGGGIFDVTIEVQKGECFGFLGPNGAGKTIFLSSHMFHEVNAVCDRIAIIKSGRIVSEFTADEVRDGPGMIYVLEFGDRKSYEAFSARGFRTAAESEERLTIKVNIGEEEMNRFVAAAAGICYMCSCIFNQSKRVMAVGGGLTIWFFLAAAGYVIGGIRFGKKDIPL